MSTSIESIPFKSTEMRVKYMKRGDAVLVKGAFIEGEEVELTRKILNYAHDAVCYIHGLTKECPKDITLH